MREKRDILLVMSDQHCDVREVFGGLLKPSDTPVMEKLTREGARYDHCYASAPLCVPSRMSFLTGRLPSELDIFNNDCVLPSDVPTIAHEMGILGYHTVLCGRMHFKGEDQHHGFDERLCGDITSQYWGTGGKKRTDFGTYAGTTNRLHCLEAVGAGISPVNVYDELVCRETLCYLEQWEKQGEERPPLFLVAGFYGPHFPYVCEESLFLKYQERISLKDCERDMEMEPFPMYQELKQGCDPELIRDCRAAYCGMVETLDGKKRHHI